MVRLKKEVIYIRPVMRLHVILSLSFSILAYACLAQNPTNINGLELWLRADSVNQTDSNFVWNDLSGLDRNAVVTISNSYPTVQSNNAYINYKPYLSFDGVNDRLLIDSAVTLGTIFVVANSNEPNDIMSSSGGIITTQSGAANQNIILVGFVNTSGFYGDGVLGSNININSIQTLNFAPFQQWKLIHGSTSVINYPNLIIGRNRNYPLYWNGGIAEIIIFNSLLTDEESAEVINYLNDRYSPSFNVTFDDYTNTDYCPISLTIPDSISDYFLSHHWSTGSSEDSIVINKTGTYSLTVTNTFGRQFADTFNVQFPGSFISPFTLCTTTDSLYTPNLEAFDVTWQDGSTDPNYLITQGGEYWLTVTDSEGCSYSDTIQVNEDLFPTEVELTENPNFCLGNELYLSSGFAEAETYHWSTGEDTPFIQPQSSGTYWIEATNANGCVGRDTVEVELVGTAPEVAFTMGTACEGNAVEFNDTTFPEGGTVTSAEWVFGGAQTPDTLTGSQVETTFPETGSYPVELTVTLDNGCTGTGRDTVRVEPLPLVGFNYDEVTPCAGNEVAFESQSGVPGNGSIASFAWAFDNGTTATGFVGSTTFETLGVHTVLHTVTTAAGCSDSLTANVVVLGSPIADFSFEPVCVGMPVVFNQQVDTSMSGPVFYNWQFGDGYFSNFPNTAHVYAGPGVYEVQLTATGNDFGNAGCKSDTTKTVRVYAPPTGMLSATDGCMGTELELTDTTTPDSRGGVTDPVVSRAWTLPYGYGQGPVALGGDSVQLWMPQEAGTYAVQLDFTTAAGCTGEASGTAEVLEVPVAAFELEVPTEMPPLTVTPVNNSTGAQGYAWLMDGMVVSNDFEPELFFGDTGMYAVALAATNSLGCNDTLVKAVEVIHPENDLALLDIRYAVAGDRLKLRLLLGNNGNTSVENLQVRTRLGLSADVRTEESFALAPGDVAEFVLPGDFEYLTSRDLPYVCVEVALLRNGEVVEEENMANNALCVGLEREKPVFISPYPNPATAEVKLGFVLPAAGVVDLSVVDSEGREVVGYSWDMKGGYSMVVIDVSGLSEGLYLFRYSYGGEVFVERVVVSD